MYKPFKIALGWVLSNLIFSIVYAGPMGFKDSWMAMGDLSTNWRETWVNYALTPRDAIGVGYLYMRSDDKTKSRNVAEVTYTRLLKRWNRPHAQSNLWFIGGLGTLQANDFDSVKTILSPGIQFDYETTRIYFAATSRLYRAQNINHDFNSLRAGFSFYEAKYTETQPWLIIEARRMNDLSDKTEITPMLRLINKQFFVEAGLSNNNDLRFNFMYIF